MTAYVEDCYWPGGEGGIIVYPPTKTTFRRCIITHCFRPDAHNQGYYTSAYENQVTFEEVILYKNGYKTDPRTDPDPKRDIYSRNIYQGGGARLGHTYRSRSAASDWAICCLIRPTLHKVGQAEALLFQGLAER